MAADQIVLSSGAPLKKGQPCLARVLKRWRKAVVQRIEDKRAVVTLRAGKTYVPGSPFRLGPADLRVDVIG